MMIQEKLMVNNKAGNIIHDKLLIHTWKVLILKTLQWLYCFVQKICFIRSFFSIGNFSLSPPVLKNVFKHILHFAAKYCSLF